MKLIITRRAEKDLASIDKPTANRIRAALDRMVINPMAVDLKKLEGMPDIWRLRVGRWRVIFRITGEEVIAYALRIKQRREVYRT